MNVFNVNYTKEQWDEIGRKNTLNLLLEHEYGFWPKECQDKLTYKCVEKKDNGIMSIEKIEMIYNHYPMYFYIYYPSGKKGIKTFITILHPLRKNTEDFINDYNKITSFCPIDEIVKQNFAVALLLVDSVANDNINGKETGIFKAMNCKKTSNSWGILSSWAWACSKVLDYLCERDEFDEKHTCVVGHSRGGKTALLASAMDERFFMAISNCSGNSGAALSRNSTGETIKDILARFPYWFNENYKKYINNEELLPFDQHHLIALQAPRNCYIASASDDSWACPENEIKSCIYASDYYKLYGLNGVNLPANIQTDVSYNKGMIAYHIKKGSHDLNNKDWKMFIEYFKENIKREYE